MSSEIVVPETPNWLQELEAKREKRLKARLGHEAGAGAPCLKCGEKCPGLDLHFWRKCCKVCKCSKEEHEVQDDDIYGWAQFQLLGSKPSKTKQKIVLPGKKDEIDLDWAPKGNKETVDKYLKTLPPEQLPVTGSQAARDRKQLLQKQIPIHDIDPNLCHELNEEELKQMNEYIAHVKQNSVGIGQIVSLSSIIKANLHMLSPADAEIITKRYAKGIPLSEIVKLQSQRMAGSLKHPELSQNLGNLSLNNKNLPNYNPNTLSQPEDVTNSVVSEIIHDKNYSAYSTESTRALPATQFSGELRPQNYNKTNYVTSENDQTPLDQTIDEKYLPNPNFDPKKRPSQFNPQFLPYQSYARQNLSFRENDTEYETGNSAFVPYKRAHNITQQNDLAGPADVQFAGVPNSGNPGIEDAKMLDPRYDSNSQYGREATPTQRETHQPLTEQNTDDRIYENLDDLRKRPDTLPSYVPGKYNVVTEHQTPMTVPKTIKDLAFSTYESEFQYGQYRQPGSYPATDLSNDSGFRPIQTADNQHIPSKNSAFSPDQGRPYSNLPSSWNAPKKPGSNSSRLGDNLNAADLENSSDTSSGGFGNPAAPSAFSPSQGRSYPNLPNNWNASQKPIENSNAKDPQIIEKPLGGFGHSAVPSAFSPNQGRPYPNLPNNWSTPQNPIENSNAKDPQITDNSSGGFGYSATPSAFSPNQGRPYPNLPNNWNASQKPIENSNAKDPQITDNLSDGFGYSATPSAFSPNQGRSYPNLPNNWSTPQKPIENSNAKNPQIIEKPLGGFGHSSDFPPYSNFPGNWNGVKPPPEANSPSSIGNSSPAKKPGGRLSEMVPTKVGSSEDFLYPSQVNVGPIQDVTYPEIRAAMHGTNDFYEDYSPDSIREIINNVKLPDCHYCKKPFEENEFAVAIDRAEVLFHADCFKCAGCNQILADNVYFYHKESDNVYCLRDYAKIRGFPRCKACDELIFTKEYCLADNATFHLKHFCCTGCDKPLAGQDYILEEEMPYCLPCFERSKASKCSSCGGVIKPDERGCTLNGVHFHAVDECFACRVCAKPLMGKKLLLRHEKLYCSHECHQAGK